MKTLVILAHPNLKNSRVNSRYKEILGNNQDFLVHDLYELYPNFKIDIQKEQELLLQHDTIILQFPLYWYNVTPLLKKWFDDVFLEGFAYGENGRKLTGKQLIISVSTGGVIESYSNSGYNKFTLSEILIPIEATANLCGMELITIHSFSGVYNRCNIEIEESIEDLVSKVEKIKMLTN